MLLWPSSPRKARTRIVCSFGSALLFFVCGSFLQVGRITTIQSPHDHDGQYVEPAILFNDTAPKPKAPFLPSILQPYREALERSDMLNLDHCDLSLITDDMWNNFTAWTDPILQDKVVENRKFQPYNLTEWQQEVTLQLLEIYLSSMVDGICDFAKYRFHRIAAHDEAKRQTFHQAEQKLRKHQQLQHRQHSVSYQATRLVFTIVAFQDLPHLQALIESIWMPQHLILIHLEQNADPEFQKGLQQWIDRQSHYKNNVIILQFGSIVYKTDSVSQTNMEIMEWLHLSTEYEYDYHVTLGGAVFPLFGAKELSNHLWNAKQNQQEVWLGELLHNGQNVHHPQAMLVWNRKRLYTTVVHNDTATKLEIRTGNIISAPVPQWLDQAMQHKSTSGNQGVYSYRVVHQLLHNPRIKHMFALAKYGCCCCLEERTWIAAMGMLELLDQAKENYSMFQVWGRPATGDNPPRRRDPSSHCEGGMKNSVLEMNDYSHACYKSENAYRGRNDLLADDNPNLMNASQLWNGIVEAKARGTLFARKFHSANANSILLRDKIVKELHGN